jgi:hypothetical protein
MRFLEGLKKCAAFERHSDGSEFKVNDTEPAAYAAGAASAPTGLPAYQTNAERLKDKKTGKKEELLNILMGKMGSFQGASGLADQLKWDVSTDDIPENFGSSKANQYSAKPKPKPVKRSES